MNKASTYEASYPRYPFAPLVELGVALAAWLKAKANKAGNSGKTGDAAGALGHAA